MAWVEEHGGGFRVRARAAGRIYTDSHHATRDRALARAAELSADDAAERLRVAQQVRLARAGSARARLGRDPLLAKWVEHWFTTLGISETTRVNYECYLRVHILPRFSGCRCR